MSFNQPSLNLVTTFKLFKFLEFWILLDQIKPINNLRFQNHLWTKYSNQLSQNKMFCLGMDILEAVAVYLSFLVSSLRVLKGFISVLSVAIGVCQDLKWQTFTLFVAKSLHLHLTLKRTLKWNGNLWIYFSTFSTQSFVPNGQIV